MRASPRVVSGSGCGHNTSNRWRDAHSWFAACQRASRPLEMTNTGATCWCSNTRALLRRSPRPPAKTTRASAGWAVSVAAWTRTPAAIPHSPPSTTTTSPRPRILRPGGHRPPRPTWCAVACRRASPSSRDGRSRDHHRPALGVTRSTTNPLIEITTAHAVGLPPALLPAPDRSHVTVRSGRLQGGLDNNAARNPPACLTDRSPARRVRRVEYRNVAGTLEDEHARRSVPAVKSALVAAPLIGALKRREQVVGVGFQPSADHSQFGGCEATHSLLPCAWTGRTSPHTLPINHRPDRVLLGEHP